MQKKYNFELYENARTLRKNMTREEKHLWYDFLSGYEIRFKRQVIVDRYILDFFCATARLAIEIDGSQHYKPEAKEYDAERTEYLRTCHGIEVIRILNRDVNDNFSSVCSFIDKSVKERIGI